jgi:hypothetical protein
MALAVEQGVVRDGRLRLRVDGMQGVMPWEIRPSRKRALS